MLLHILLNSEKLLAEIKIAQTKQSISVYEHSQKNTPYIEKRSPYETTFVLHYSQMPIFFVKHQLLRLHSCAGKIIGICIKRRIFRKVRICSLHSDAGKIISICIKRRKIVRSEKKSASGNEHAKEACKRKPRTQKAACISKPLSLFLHISLSAGKFVILCIRRRIFREVRVSEQIRECAYSAYAIERICDRNDVIRGKDSLTTR